MCHSNKLKTQLNFTVVYERSPQLKELYKLILLQTTVLGVNL